MEITFGDQFDKESRDKFNISRQMVRDALWSPLNLEEIDYLKLKLMFVTKEINDGQLLLVLARKKDKKIQIDQAFRVKKELMRNILLSKPSLILDKLTEHFGFYIKIGDVSSKLIITKTIPLKNNSNNEIWKVVNPQNKSFSASMYIKIAEDRKSAECALVFAINTDQYKNWIFS